jgi:hypothetical protein
MAVIDMDFFPQRPDTSPKIYAYEHIGVASQKGYIKVGYKGYIKKDWNRYILTCKSGQIIFLKNSSSALRLLS